MTTNLATALAQLRHTYRERVVWADAVCIDQESYSERSQQVPLMAKIFSNAYRVLVWLGEEGVDSALGMDVAKTLWDFIEVQNFGSESGSAESLQPPEVNEGELTALENLFVKHPWWQRLWVVQEISLSGRARIICGPRTLDWAAITALRTGILEMRLWNSEPSRRLGGVFAAAWELDMLRTVNQTEAGVVRPRLASLMQQFSRKKCSDPRDLCYGLLAMAPLRKVSLKPAYDKPLEQIFTHVTRLMIEDSRVLDVICLTRAVCWRQKKSLPSWVPVWQTLADCPDPHDVQKAKRVSTHWKAEAAEITLGITPKHEQHILRVMGVAMDRVAYLADGPKCSAGSLIEMARPWIVNENLDPEEVDAEAMSQAIAAGYSKLVEMLQCEWDEIEGYPGSEKWSPEAKTLYRLGKLSNIHLCWLEDYACAASLPLYQNLDSHCRAAELSPRRSAQTLGAYLDKQILSRKPEHRTWKFCATVRGFWAMVPLDTGVGDYITALDGAVDQVVLRAKHGELGVDGNFELVGAAFANDPFTYFDGSSELRTLHLERRLFPLV